MTVRSNRAAKLKEKYENCADSKAKGKFDGTKGPAKVARGKTWKKGDEDNEEEGGRKKLLLFHLVDTLRVGSTMIDTPLTQVSVAHH